MVSPIGIRDGAMGFRGEGCGTWGEGSRMGSVGLDVCM